MLPDHFGMTNNEEKNLSTRLGKREVFCTTLAKPPTIMSLTLEVASEVCSRASNGIRLGCACFRFYWVHKICTHSVYKSKNLLPLDIVLKL